VGSLLLPLKHNYAIIAVLEQPVIIVSNAEHGSAVILCLLNCAVLVVLVPAKTTVLNAAIGLDKIRN
jgi:hypothetical protein